jgi:hypothetical protein
MHSTGSALPRWTLLGGRVSPALSMALNCLPSGRPRLPEQIPARLIEHHKSNGVDLQSIPRNNKYGKAEVDHD